MNEGYFRHIVDLGFGRGGFASVCGQERDGVIGLDNDPTAASICLAQGLPCLLGDVGALPFASSSFDVARAKEVSEHLTDVRSILQEV